MFSSNRVVRGNRSHTNRNEEVARARRTRLSLLSLEGRITPVRISSPYVDGVTASITASAPTENSSLWTELTAVPPAPEGKTSYLELESFLPFTLNSTAMQAVLGQAPLESNVAAPDSPLIVALPKPDGTMAHFRMVNMPMMEPELAAQFPEIQTYRGQGIEDPAATLAADFTPHGFHAQVLSPDGSWYIDPYFHLDTSVYVSYFRSNVSSREGMPCEIDHSGLTSPAELAPEEDHEHSDGEEDELALRSGTQLRTYRTAVSATTAYTNFFGGTVPAALAGIVTAVNRVTGVYEVELSIRLSLVANNNLIVFTNADNPFFTTSTPGSTMLNQNQTAIDSRIGSANYDIGHVFSTGNGGIAQLGVVGSATSKAKGATGLPSPIGDVFYIDYVSHEMGHQFRANHTFNVSSGQRNASTAYEPGSGSTIMAYAGLFGANDLQPFSDAYFHSISFDEIISFVDNLIPSVGTRTNTGNIVPVINPLTNFVIPTLTPFALTASATDGNGDTLTYNWEQRSLGPAQNLSDPDNGSSPIFRSWFASTNPTRTFPRLSNLINNNLPIGEKYPAVARSQMPFRVTVRDNRAGGGGVNTRDMSVQIVNTGSAFSVTSQNSFVNYPGNSAQNVTWNVAGTTGSGINTANVNILLSTNGGQTFSTVLLANTPNDGSESITIPNVATTQARIKVEPVGNIYFDMNNVNFTITQQTTPPPQVTSVTVNGGVGFQRSMVRSIEVTFNSLVNFSGPTAAAFQVARFGGGNLGAFTATPNNVGGVTVVTLTAFGGAESQGSSLADGRYQLTAFANQISNAGGQLGGGVTNYTFGQADGPEYLTRFFGDWTGDRRVDGADLPAFTSTYNLNSSSPQFLTAFDYNDSTNVDGFDFGFFVLRYNTQIP